jgi:hypothetical protein
MIGSSAAFSFLSDEPMRPVSLGTLEVLGRLQMELLLPQHTLAVDDEAAQIAFFRWLHVSPLHDVQRALWLGTARDIGYALPPPPDEVVALFRVERDLLCAAISAVSVRVRKKPGADTSDPPPDIVYPSLHEVRLFRLMAATGQPREHLEWHTGVVEALRIYHCALWSEGIWTVPDVANGPEAKEDDFEDYGSGIIDTHEMA